MSIIKLYILCLLGHYLADFTLQGCLAQMKQKQWWKDEIYKWNQTHHGNSALDYENYKNDWICALNSHSFYWAIVTFLPLFLTNAPDNFIIIAMLINWFVHSIVDHLKCNLHKINLRTDQTCHLMQILLTVIITKSIFQ